MIVPGRWVHAVVLLAAALAILLAPGQGRARPRSPELQTTVSAQDVEVGETFVVQLAAMVSATDQLPERPTLPVPPGLVLQSGPSISSQTKVSITGGNIVQQVGVAVSWRLEAKRQGTYRIGPPSVQWGGTRYDANPVQVRVLPKGALPRRRPPSRNDPFDMFDIFGLPRLPGLFGQEPPPLGDPLLPPTDPALAMARAPSPVVFLRADVDKQQVVLGEQVTFSVYQYFQTASLRQTEAREASAPDFLQKPLLAPDEDPGIQHAEVGSSTWRVRLLRRTALFPLRSGDLTISRMQVMLRGMGLRGEVSRSTEAITVRVREAPDAGRPVGYQPGDVGEFELQARVDPREVEAGGAVAVAVTLRGEGNFPNALQTPARKGQEWLEPQIREDVAPDDGVLRGSKTFTYVVRLREPGRVDLGEVTLPYYSPERRGYATASAALGGVTVRPATKTAEHDVAPVDRFAAVAGPRAQLQPYPEKGVPLTDRAWYWVLLAAAPLSVMAAGGLAGLWRRVRSRFSAWRTSLDRKAALALRDAKTARAAGDAKAAAAAVERALHATIERATGVKSRGVLRDELAERLMGAGASASVAHQLATLLAECEAVRFDPSFDEERLDALLRAAQDASRTPTVGAKKS